MNNQNNINKPNNIVDAIDVIDVIDEDEIETIFDERTDNRLFLMLQEFLALYFEWDSDDDLECIRFFMKCMAGVYDIKIDHN